VGVKDITKREFIEFMGNEFGDDGKEFAKTIADHVIMMWQRFCAASDETITFDVAEMMVKNERICNMKDECGRIKKTDLVKILTVLWRKNEHWVRTYVDKAIEDEKLKIERSWDDPRIKKNCKMVRVNYGKYRDEIDTIEIDEDDSGFGSFSQGE